MAASQDGSNARDPSHEFGSSEGAERFAQHAGVDQAAVGIPAVPEHHDGSSGVEPRPSKRLRGMHRYDIVSGTFMKVSQHTDNSEERVMSPSEDHHGEVPPQQQQNSGAAASAGVPSIQSFAVATRAQYVVPSVQATPRTLENIESLASTIAVQTLADDFRQEVVETVKQAVISEQNARNEMQEITHRCLEAEAQAAEGLSESGQELESARFLVGALRSELRQERTVSEVSINSLRNQAEEYYSFQARLTEQAAYSAEQQIQRARMAVVELDSMHVERMDVKDREFSDECFGLRTEF